MSEERGSVIGANTSDETIMITGVTANWPSIGLISAPKLSLFFPEAYFDGERFRVTVKFSCKPCKREMVFSFYVDEVPSKRGFGCHTCKATTEKVIRPLTIYY